MKHRFSALGGLLLAGLLACSQPPADTYYQPSKAADFDFSSEQSFARYVAFEHRKLANHRVFFDARNSELELERVAPFELPMPDYCPPKPKSAVLLVHGLLDTAYGLKDIGIALAKSCALVRGILLPGHGTRPADLIGIDRQSWVDAVDFGIRSFSGAADQLTIIGFSLGGALAVDAAADSDEVDRVILIAPALHVAFPWLAAQSVWYRYLATWLDIDPHSIPVRYQSMPTDAVAEAYLMGRDARVGLQRGLSQPVLTFLSADDLVIDADKVSASLATYLPKQAGNTVIYQKSAQADEGEKQFIPVFDPQAKILNFSHVALPYSPENPIFGAYGSHKECGMNIGIVDRAQAEECVHNEANWKGEMGSTDNPDFLPIQRLTFNSRFAEMVTMMRDFMGIPDPQYAYSQD